MSLSERTALVTGGSRGIGRSVAIHLAKAGADVAINYNGNEQAAKQTAVEIEELGRKALIYQANVGEAQSVSDMIQTVIKDFGKLDILVNNAGITRDNLLMRMKEEEWDDVLQINLKGVYNCTKAVTRQMMKQRFGRIINISSVVGTSGNPGQANYAAAKAGIIGLTKTVAKELSSRRITVNAVAPGFIDTDMTAELGEEIHERLISQIPLGRLGNAEEVAKVVCFLASDDASYITGQTVHVDGGMGM